MKKGIPIFFLTFLTIFFIFLSAFQHQPIKTGINGTWQLQNTPNQELLQFVNGYLTHTTYNKAEKKFIQTHGGTYTFQNGQLTVNIEFNTNNKETVGNTVSYQLDVNGTNMVFHKKDKQESWKKLDDAAAPLAGVWRITERMQDGKLVPIHQSGTRKTLKILTDTRFQWVAIDPGTKEFSGTGGGTYTFKDGKYTEHIEFFSRDSSRVGAALSFDDKLENGGWHHTGLSSRGDKIYEVWRQVKEM